MHSARIQHLFEPLLAKDNDLLLSMPTPVRTILLSRLLSVYLMGLLYSGVVLLPAMIVYWVTVSGRAHRPCRRPAAVCPCHDLRADALMRAGLGRGEGQPEAEAPQHHGGTDVAAVPRRLLFCVFQGAELSLGACDERRLLRRADPRQGLSALSDRPCRAGDGPAMAVVTAVVLVLFILLFWLLSRSFLRIATASGSTVRRVYREKTAVQRGAGTALLARELRHFGGNPSYMLNCGLGILLMPLGGTALLWEARSSGWCCSLWSAGRGSRSSCARWCACGHP